MSNLPPAAERLIRRTRTTQQLPKIHYWHRIIKEVKNQKKPDRWNCFTNLQNPPAIKKSQEIKINQRIYLGENFSDTYLTKREFECLVLLKSNLTYRHIGTQLGLSKRTVEFYFKVLKKKLKCHSKKQLFQLVMQANFCH